jgi:hypothetical protein
MSTQLASPSAANLAAPFLELLPIAGLAISIIGPTGQQSTIHASNPISARIEEIQFDLGEGPIFAAFASGRPVLLADVDAVAGSRWPTFAAEVSALSVGAIYVFPLVLGAACVGAVVSYGSIPRRLAGEEVERGSALGRAIAGPALDRAVRLAGVDGGGAPTTPVELRRDVHQATGMVLAQLGITATEALSRIRGRAYSTGLTVREVSRDVIDHRLDFSQTSD